MARCKPARGKRRASWKSCAALFHRSRIAFETLEDRRLLSVSIGDLVWHDLNANGIQDGGEPGLAGVAVELFASADGTIGNADDVSRGVAVTDAAGRYTVGDAAAGGNYYLAWRAPAGFAFSAQGQGGDQAADSDANTAGVTAMLALAPGEVRADLDAGLTGAAPWFGFAASAGATSTSSSGQIVATDAIGNVCIAGTFGGTVDLDPGPGTRCLVSAGSADVFVAKYTATGALIWARSLGGSGVDQINDIAIAADGSVYATGLFTGTVDFDPGPDTFLLTSAGGTDAFVWRLDASGSLVEALAMGGLGNDAGSEIAFGPEGSLYLMGRFQGTVDFDPSPGTATLTSTSVLYGFVTRWDAAGRFLWAKAVVGSTADTDLAVGADGSIYATGRFTGTVDFDPGAGVFNLTSAGQWDAFVLKLDVLGNFAWARRVGGTSYDSGSGIAVHDDGSVYATGSFNLTVDFDPGPGTFNLTSAGQYDAFVLKLDALGNFLQATRIGGSGADSSSAIALGPDGSIFCMGGFQGTVDFDPGEAGTYSLASAGSRDVFVFKLDASANFAWAFRMGGGGADSGYGLALGPDGSVCTAGYFSGTADFDPAASVFELAAASSAEFFVSRFRATSQAPLEIWISAAAVPENLPGGSVVAALSTIDPDLPHDAHGYSLVPGPGDEGNSSFLIEGSQLKTAEPFDYESRPTYSIRVRTTDWDGHWHEQAFVISVEDLDESLSVGDRVWNDLDADGIQDPDEPGAEGVEVEVFRSLDGVAGNADDHSRGTTVTDSSGHYLLAGLSPGESYYLVFHVEGRRRFSDVHLGGDPTADNDADADGATAIFAMASGQSRMDIDAGLASMATWFGFAGAVGGSEVDIGEAIATDSDGNVHLAGTFSRTVDFDPGPGVCNLVSAGGLDVFVAKYTAAGDLLWARSLGGNDYDQVRDIAVAADGSVCTTGCFQGTADFDPGPDTFYLTSAGGEDGFVSKLDASGNFVRAVRIGGDGSDQGTAIALAPNGSLCFAGNFEGVVDFDPGPGTVSLGSVGAASCFVARWDTAGSFIWAKIVGGSISEESLAMGADGSVYATGSFSNTRDFDPGPGVYNLTSAGQADIFILKLDAHGDLAWARGVGGNTYGTYLGDYGHGIGIHEDGSVYTGGYFESTVDFDPGPGVHHLTSAGWNDAFVLKLDASGSFVWARRFGGSEYDDANAVAVAGDGSVYVTGEFEGAVDFASGEARTCILVSAGLTDVFVSKFDSSGNFVLARRMGGSGADYGRALTVAPDGSVCAAGNFRSTADFDVGPRTPGLAGAGSFDAFFMRFHPIPQSPLEMLLSSSSVPENLPRGSLVGALSTIDPDLPNDAHYYNLVPGAGDEGNSFFLIDGDHLELARPFDYETQSSYPIRLRTTDWDGHWHEQTFVISVEDLDESLSVGDLVWSDLDGDGIQDAGEPGVAGVAVEVLGSFDAVVGNSDDYSCGMTVTDASGHYTLAGLSPNVNYYLIFHTSGGARFSPRNAGDGPAADSDANLSGTTELFVLAPGQSRLDIDAGLADRANRFGFVSGIGGTGDDEGSEVAVDHEGNIYVTGSFAGTVDFDPGPGTHYSTSTRGAFVAKYSMGGALLWGGSFNTQWGGGAGIALADDGSVLVTGGFSDTVDFDPGPDVFNLTSAGSNDIFVWKLTTSGDLLWARSVGGSGTEYARAIAVAADGSIHVTGDFTGTADFDPGPGSVTLTSRTGSRDIFVLKLDTSGDFVWAARIGGGTQSVFGIALAADRSVYTAGCFQGTVDFDPSPGTFNLASGSDNDIFVCKFDASGRLVWARDFGDTGDDSGTAIAVAPDGGVCFAGYFSNTVDFDPGPGTFNLTSAGAQDTFVCKLDAASHLVWARGLGGAGYETGYGIAVGRDGSVATMGYFFEKVDFDPGPRTFLLDAESSGHTFICTLDASGNYVWARASGGDLVRGITVADDGSTCLTGSFRETADFDPSSDTLNLTSAGGKDAVVVRVSAPRAPAQIVLSNSAVPENQAPGTVVGTLSTMDPDLPNDSHVYAFTSGEGDLDNAFFLIEGNQLKAVQTCDYEARTSYWVRVRTTDFFGQFLEQAFIITVTDVDDSLSVGGRVWSDANGNGIQDPGESALPGMVVEVLRSIDAEAGNGDDYSRGTTVTDAGGAYALDGLSAGENYYVVFRGLVGPLVSVRFSPHDQGDGMNDSDADAGGVTGMFTVLPGTVQANVDAGVSVGAPWFGFAGQAGGAGTDEAQAIVADEAGNVYVTGWFSDTVDFDLSSAVFHLTAVGGTDLFVAKYAGDGALVWARAMGGNGDESGYAIALGPDGSVHVTGSFTGTADLDPGPGTYYLLGASKTNAFVVKLDASGDFLWAQGVCGADVHAYSRAICVMPDGTILTTGGFEGTADFDPGTATHSLTSAGNADIFLWKLDAWGNFVSATRIGGTGYDVGHAIALAADGSIYVAGGFSSTVDFDPGAGTFNLTSTGGTNIFVLKLDAGGNFAWAASAGGPEYEYPYHIAVARDGSVYTTGYFFSTADFDPGPGTFNLVSAGSQDAFVWKLDASGNLVWARRMGSTQHDYGYGVAVRSDGSVYTTGYFYSTADFDPGPGVFDVTSAGSTDVFVSKLDTAGKFVWARRLGGSGADKGYGVAVTVDGSVCVTGSFSSTADFDPGPGEFNLTRVGSPDAFLLKISPLATEGIIPGTAGNDAVRIAGNAGNSSQLDLFAHWSDAGPVFSAWRSDFGHWHFEGGAGDDQVTVDYSNGNPLPSGGLVFEGGQGTGDRLVIRGGAARDNVTLAVDQLSVEGTPLVRFSGIEAMAFDLGGGNNQVTVASGTVRIDRADGLTPGTGLTIGAGGTMVLAAGLSAETAAQAAAVVVQASRPPEENVMVQAPGLPEVLVVVQASRLQDAKAVEAEEPAHAQARREVHSEHAGNLAVLQAADCLAWLRGLEEQAARGGPARKVVSFHRAVDTVFALDHT